MKVRIASVDASNAVLPHKNRGMGVVKNIPSEVRNVPEDLPNDGGVTLRLHKHAQCRCAQYGIDK